MRTLITRLHQIAEHPLTNLAIAFVLMASALLEAEESFLEPLVRGEVGVHHGVLLFGVAQAVKTLPDLVEGFERVTHGAKRE